MKNQDAQNRNQQTLEIIAELLLWAGFDCAADAIYADLGMGLVDCDSSAGMWSEVFGG